jgi:hypothetical protein
VLAAADGEAEMPEVRLLLLIISLVLRSLLECSCSNPAAGLLLLLLHYTLLQRDKATMDNGIGVGHLPSRIFGYLTVQKKEGFLATFSCPFLIPGNNRISKK